MNSSLDESTSDVEVQDISVKVLFVTIACISMTSSVVALTTMWNTRQTPYVTKILSSGLLIFDASFILTSTARKFITHLEVNVSIQIFVVIFLQLAYFTVGMMAVERYILIIKPMFYMRTFTPKKVKTLVFLIWTTEACLCLFFRYGVCYFLNPTVIVFTTAAICNKTLSRFYLTLVAIVLCVSFICYTRIFIALRSQVRSKASLATKRFSMTAQKLTTTALSFIYLIVILISSIAYIIILILVNLEQLELTGLRLALEIVSLFNCIMDPFLYVVWYKESRFIILRCLSTVCVSLQKHADEMKIEVYDIVTTSKKVIDDKGLK